MKQQLKEWVRDPETGMLVLLGAEEIEAQRIALLAMRHRPSAWQRMIAAVKRAIQRYLPTR